MEFDNNVLKDELLDHFFYTSKSTNMKETWPLTDKILI